MSRQLSVRGDREEKLIDTDAAGTRQTNVRPSPAISKPSDGVSPATRARNTEVLAAAGYRVLVPDMPGYGRSSKDLDESDPFGDLAIFVRGLLDTLDVQKAHLVGNSYGGAAALRLALDRPDRVEKLVLMGPGGIGATRRPPTKG